MELTQKITKRKQYVNNISFYILKFLIVIFAYLKINKNKNTHLFIGPIKKLIILKVKFEGFNSRMSKLKK